MYTSSPSTGSRQARDTIPLVRATDLHRDEADYATLLLVVVEEGSAEEEEGHRIRLEALAAMISFEGSCRIPCIVYSYGSNGIRMGSLG